MSMQRDGRTLLAPNIELSCWFAAGFTGHIANQIARVCAQTLSKTPVTLLCRAENLPAPWYSCDITPFYRYRVSVARCTMKYVRARANIGVLLYLVVSPPEAFPILSAAQTVVAADTVSSQLMTVISATNDRNHHTLTETSNPAVLP